MPSAIAEAIAAKLEISPYDLSVQIQRHDPNYSTFFAVVSSDQN
jgi:hypothetical protein